METEPGKIPEIDVQTATGESVRLNWLNTVLRTYKDAAYNHVEMITSGGNRIGLIAPQSVMDALFELDFPSTFHPSVDNGTVEWFVGVTMAGLEEELDAL